MALEIDGKRYYRTTEAYHAVGISRTTFFRWLREGIGGGSMRRDVRGWRLFTKEDIDSLMAHANRITEYDGPTSGDVTPDDDGQAQRRNNDN